MRIGLLSDVHANLEALERVLAFFAGAGVEEVVFGGDFVGYGADPEAVVARASRDGWYAVAGNHDRAVTGEIPFENFSPAAQTSVRWTREKVSAETISYLRSLPNKARFPTGSFEWMHGGPRDPLEEYCDTVSAVSGAFRYMENQPQPPPILFLGHTHRPFLASKGGEAVVRRPLVGGEEIEVGDEGLLVNLGSAGQPRDGDPRAACGILDEARGLFTFHRIEYDVARAAAKVRSVEFSSWEFAEELARRLERGE